MEREIKFYRDHRKGKNVVEIYTLSFISDRSHCLGWFGLHYRHFRIKMLLKWADVVYVPETEVAIDLVRYYFYPREKIIVHRGILSADKA